MTPEQIKALAKQAGGTSYVTGHAAFNPGQLAEFARLVRESSLEEAVEYLDGRQYHGLAEYVRNLK